MSTATSKSTIQPLAEIGGKRAIAKFGTLAPAMFGTTVFQIFKDRVVERSTGPIARRTCHLLATDIESAEIITAGNPLYLVLGLATIAMFGLGILFLLLYFLLKHKFLVISSGGTVIALAIKGDEESYHQFLNNVTKVALHCKRNA